ncbi:MAG TPA: glycosyltransferase family 39 protein [Candidatus Dormibacteraeota bacterium]|nr:glycosyltransferase family 39 protein [Candidatus Dormibacteraeota bacterium]
MQSRTKHLLCSPGPIAWWAFATRMVLLCGAWIIGPHAIRSLLPYGYELGQVARSIALGQGFSSPLRTVHTGPTIWFTPIYPYFVAGIFKIFGIFTDTSHFVIQTFNCAFAALTVIPIYKISRKTFSEGVAVTAAWVWVFLPTALFFPITWIWDTSLTALFFALLFWLTLEMRGAQSISAWAGYGALWGIGVMINPSVLSVFPFLLAWLLWEARKEAAPWGKFAVSTLLVFTVAMVPWTIRNYRVFGKFIVLRSNFGLELWLGNNPNVPQTWSPWMHPNDDPQEGEKYKRMGELAYMAEKQKEAFAFMRTHPKDTANFIFRRFIDNWLAVTDSPVDTWSSAPLYLKAFMAENILFALATMLGGLFAYHERRPNALPFVIVLLIFPLVFYLTHTSLRYRFPMDPMMIVLAVHGVAYPISHFRRRFGRQTDAVTPAASIPTP